MAGIHRARFPLPPGPILAPYTDSTVAASAGAIEVNSEATSYFFSSAPSTVYFPSPFSAPRNGII
ncbi:hypothetical protein MFLAVUS_010182 [Mucor flavus]|uniref:Uncharacterized protein n=1 Tax=Mucor flavus TaxID=439312 RepID=A0ABP9ZC03_9FUNG